MTCCLLLRLFAGDLLDREGAQPGGRRATFRMSPTRALAMRLGRNWRGWLSAIAVLEVVAAWLLVRTLRDLNDGSGPAMATMGNDGISRTGAGLAVGLVLAATLAGGAMIRAGSGRFGLYLGFACFGLACLPVVRAAAAQSHMVFMGQAMLVMVVAPLLLMSAVVPVIDRLPGRALLAAAGYLVVLYLWHLPATHRAAMANPGWDWVRLASCIAIGAAFWANARARLSALLVVGAGSGLLGLALVVGPQPLFAMGADPLGLSALSDQRLAGLLMTAVDLFVLLPVITHAADALPPVVAPAQTQN